MNGPENHSLVARAAISSPPRLGTPALSDFFLGLALPLRGLSVVLRARKLRWLSVLCALVTALALFFVLYAVVSWLPGWVDHFWPRPQGFKLAGWWLAYAVAAVALGVAGVLGLPLVALAPLQDPLSEATEAAVGLGEARPFSFARLLRETFVGLVHTSFRLTILLAGQGLLLGLLLTGVTSPLWPWASALWSAAWLSAEYLSIPMARHLHPFAHVRKALWRRRWLTLGLGLSLTVLLWVPVLNFFLVPVAVASGTLFYAGMRAGGELPPPGRAQSR